MSLILQEMDILEHPFIQAPIDIESMIKSYVKPFLLVQPFPALTYQLLLPDPLPNIVSLLKHQELLHHFFVSKK